MQFLMLIAHDANFRADPALIQSIFEWVDAQAAAGVRVSGAPLMPPHEARTVSVRDGNVSITQQPFTPGPLHAAAIEIIECEDLDAAAALAATHPMAQRATIEVRPIWAELDR